MPNCYSLLFITTCTNWPISQDANASFGISIALQYLLLLSEHQLKPHTSLAW